MIIKISYNKSMLNAMVLVFTGSTLREIDISYLWKRKIVIVASADPKCKAVNIPTNLNLLAIYQQLDAAKQSLHISPWMPEEKVNWYR